MILNLLNGITINTLSNLRILHLEYKEYPTEAIELLEKNAVVIQCNCDSQIDLLKFISIDNEFDVVFTRLGIYLDKNVIDHLPKLEYIVTSTTGLNHIDIEYAQIKNVKVVSLKGEADFLASIKSTAEHTWMLVLSLLRNHINAHKSVIDEGNWLRKPFLADELDGKNLGIIGFGRLGKIVSNYGNSFGMNVLAYDTKKIDENKYQVTNVTLDQLLVQSDVVILLINWSKENENFFNEHLFSKMKKTAYFINTSRGELVNENDLISALKTNTIKGAALDVINGDSSWESKYEGNIQLLEYARNNTNLLITPHMGGYGKDSIHKTRNFTVNKFINLISKP
jgi:D-3-phosphoglycerate dehydrogenase